MKKSLLTFVCFALVLLISSCGGNSKPAHEEYALDTVEWVPEEVIIDEPIINPSDDDEEDEDKEIVKEVKELVKNVRTHLPGNIWDSMVFDGIDFSLEKEEIEIDIDNTFRIKPKLEMADLGELNQLGMLFVFNFMEAYRSAINYEKVEGETEVYKNVGPLLKAAARYDFSIKFNLEDKDGKAFSFTIGPKYVSRGVLLKKEE